MKKEFFAAFTIVVLLFASVFNLLQIKKLTESTTELLNVAMEAYTVSDFATAEQSLSKALKQWSDAEKYTHIFVRATEIDATTDALYEALSAIGTPNISQNISIAKANYHLQNIYEMERPKLQNVF